MNYAINIIAIVSGIVGTIGGILVIVAWVMTHRSRREGKLYEEWVKGLVELLGMEHEPELSASGKYRAKVTYIGVEVVTQIGINLNHAKIAPEYQKWAARGVTENRLGWAVNSPGTVLLPFR